MLIKNMLEISMRFTSISGNLWARGTYGMNWRQNSNFVKIVLGLGGELNWDWSLVWAKLERASTMTVANLKKRSWNGGVQCLFCGYLPLVPTGQKSFFINNNCNFRIYFWRCALSSSCFLRNWAYSVWAVLAHSQSSCHGAFWILRANAVQINVKGTRCIIICACFSSTNLCDRHYSRSDSVTPTVTIQINYSWPSCQISGSVWRTLELSALKLIFPFLVHYFRGLVVILRMPAELKEKKWSKTLRALYMDI